MILKIELVSDDDSAFSRSIRLKKGTMSKWSVFIYLLGALTGIGVVEEQDLKDVSINS